MKLTIPGGAFLVIEGIDGAGKSTQVMLVADALKHRNLDVVITHEPTNGIWGKFIRSISISERLPAEKELELFLKDREEHVEKVIKPSLALGKIVISDRYYLSTVAYQGSRGFPIEQLLQINEEFAPQPDLAVILDIEPSEALERLKARGTISSFEQFHSLEKCRQIYRSIQRPFVFILDATMPPPKIRDAILFELGRRLLNRWACEPTLDPTTKLEAAVVFHGGSL